ncbi:hypothetical protein AL755_03745 (plasmid) [Arthrobacter sp. ERGS1:01]|uniref:hypothetical protein n=1 Tax=Arthrobacter sp. ERGS1:01 TaxID=1704044 RepID=UPI0006B432DC|nr:hypothetical protein [Arthrobacter sp. ERGS1:01]ALE04806.1 hypothetical protein AL755_03745 [Arthrobacter sp. ERGS1:01]
MPVITVFAPDPASIDSSQTLAALNLATSQALGLPPEAVHSMLIPAATGCTGTTPTTAWPTAIMHGRLRDAGAMTAAADAAARALASAYQCPPEQTWVQWVVTTE